MNLHSSHLKNIHHLDCCGQVSLVGRNQECKRRLGADYRFFVNPVKITQPVFSEPGRIGQGRLGRRIVIVHDISQCPFSAFPGQGHFNRRFLHRAVQLIEFNGDGSGQPYAGDFGQDPETGGSCDATPTNAVWFNYTPTVSGWYEVLAQNHTTAWAYSRLAMFEGVGCDPLGTELFCETANSKTVLTAVDLTADTSYLILFHTDDDSYPMVDPEVSFTPADPGEICPLAADVTEGQAWPPEFVDEIERRCATLDLQALADDTRQHDQAAARVRRYIMRIDGARAGLINLLFGE